MSDKEKQESRPETDTKKRLIIFLRYSSSPAPKPVMICTFKFFHATLLSEQNTSPFAVV